MSLAGRVAIITGASSGIGAACARAFGREGPRTRRADARRGTCDDGHAAGKRHLVILPDARV